MEQYRLLAECLLPAHMLDWFDLQNVSNKDAHGRRGCIIAIVKGTKAKDVIKALKKIDKSLRKSVVEVTLDFSESLRSIVKAYFPDAMITLDRFHHQQFCLEALQEVRREHRREQMTRDTNEREEHRLKMKELARKDGPWVDDEGDAIRRNARCCPERLENDETRAELLARSRGLLIGRFYKLALMGFCSIFEQIYL